MDKWKVAIFRATLSLRDKIRKLNKNQGSGGEANIFPIRKSVPFGWTRP